VTGRTQPPVPGEGTANPAILRDAREALARWERAVEGDSNDAEHDAGCGLAEELRWCIGVIEAASVPPGSIVLTADQIAEWAGGRLSEQDLRRLADCIPRSSIPDSIGEIVAGAPGVTFGDDPSP
jgi:hypothetical protein